MRAGVKCELSRDCRLDNPTRYSDYGTLDQWRKSIFRCPGLTEFKVYNLQCPSEQIRSQFEVKCEQPGDDWCKHLVLQQHETQALLCLLDREAIEMGMIEVVLLDWHVNSTCHIRMTPWLLARDYALGVCIH